MFLDTNIWLRYFIGDDREHLEAAGRILELGEEGRVRLATSTFVLSEFIYVETSFYKITKKEIIDDLDIIQSMKNMRIIDVTDFNKSLKLFKRSRERKWSDCVIVSQVPKNYLFCSFDNRLKKLIGVDRFINPRHCKL